MRKQPSRRVNKKKLTTRIISFVIMLVMVFGVAQSALAGINIGDTTTSEGGIIANGENISSTEGEEPPEGEQPEEDQDIEQKANSEITGFVWNDINEDGLQQEEEEGINGIKLLLQKQNEDGSWIEVDKQETKEMPDEQEVVHAGIFAFENIEQGTYRVQVVLEGENAEKYEVGIKGAANDPEAKNDSAFYQNKEEVVAEDRNATDPIVLDGENTVIANCAILEKPEQENEEEKEEVAGSSISGYVWNDQNKNGILDEGETGMQAMNVVLQKYEPNTDEWMKMDEQLSGSKDAGEDTHASLADGYFSFENLSEGKYRVYVANLEEYSLKLTAVEKDAQLQQKDVATDMNAELGVSKEVLLDGTNAAQLFCGVAVEVKIQPFGAAWGSATLSLSHTSEEVGQYPATGNYYIYDDGTTVLYKSSQAVPSIVYNSPYGGQAAYTRVEKFNLTLQTDTTGVYDGAKIVVTLPRTYTFSTLKPILSGGKVMAENDPVTYEKRIIYTLPNLPTNTTLILPIEVALGTEYMSNAERDITAVPIKVELFDDEDTLRDSLTDTFTQDLETYTKFQSDFKLEEPTTTPIEVDAGAADASSNILASSANKIAIPLTYTARALGGIRDTKRYSSITITAKLPAGATFNAADQLKDSYPYGPKYNWIYDSGTHTISRTITPPKYSNEVPTGQYDGNNRILGDNYADAGLRELGADNYGSSSHPGVTFVGGYVQDMSGTKNLDGAVGTVVLRFPGQPIGSTHEITDIKYTAAVNPDCLEPGDPATVTYTAARGATLQLKGLQNFPYYTNSDYWGSSEFASYYVPASKKLEIERGYSFSFCTPYVHNDVTTFDAYRAFEGRAYTEGMAFHFSKSRDSTFSNFEKINVYNAEKYRLKVEVNTTVDAWNNPNPATWKTLLADSNYANILTFDNDAAFTSAGISRKDVRNVRITFLDKVYYSSRTYLPNFAVGISADASVNSKVQDIIDNRPDSGKEALSGGLTQSHFIDGIAVPSDSIGSNTVTESGGSSISYNGTPQYAIFSEDPVVPLRANRAYDQTVALNQKYPMQWTMYSRPNSSSTYKGILQFESGYGGDYSWQLLNPNDAYDDAQYNKNITNLKANVLLPKGLQYVENTGYQNNGTWKVVSQVNNADGTTALEFECARPEYIANGYMKLGDFQELLNIIFDVFTMPELITSDIEWSTSFDILDDQANVLKDALKLDDNYGQITWEVNGETVKASAKTTITPNYSQAVTVNKMGLSQDGTWSSDEIIAFPGQEVRFRQYIYNNTDTNVIADIKLADVLPKIGDDLGSEFNMTMVGGFTSATFPFDLMKETTDTLNGIADIPGATWTPFTGNTNATGILLQDSSPIDIPAKSVFVGEYTLKVDENASLNQVAYNPLYYSQAGNPYTQASKVKIKVAYPDVSGIAFVDLNANGVKDYFDANGNGIYDTGDLIDPILASAQLTLGDPVPGVSPVTTDYQGKYTFKNVPPGDHQIKMTQRSPYLPSTQDLTHPQGNRMDANWLAPVKVEAEHVKDVHLGVKTWIPAKVEKEVGQSGTNVFSKKYTTSDLTDTFRYRVTVEFPHDMDAYTSFYVKDTLPAGLTYVPGTGTIMTGGVDASAYFDAPSISGLNVHINAKGNTLHDLAGKTVVFEYDGVFDTSKMNILEMQKLFTNTASAYVNNSQYNSEFGHPFCIARMQSKAEVELQSNGIEGHLFNDWGNTGIASSYINIQTKFVLQKQNGALWEDVAEQAIRRLTINGIDAYGYAFYNLEDATYRVVLRDIQTGYRTLSPVQAAPFDHTKNSVNANGESVPVTFTGGIGTEYRSAGVRAIPNLALYHTETGSWNKTSLTYSAVGEKLYTTVIVEVPSANFAYTEDKIVTFSYTDDNMHNLNTVDMKLYDAAYNTYPLSTIPGGLQGSFLSQDNKGFTFLLKQADIEYLKTSGYRLGFDVESEVQPVGQYSQKQYVAKIESAPGSTWESLPISAPVSVSPASNTFNKYLRGYLWTDRNGDGNADNTLGDYAVNLYKFNDQNGQWEFFATTQTDRYGQYMFQLNQNGRYRLQDIGEMAGFTAYNPTTSSSYSPNYSHMDPATKVTDEVVFSGIAQENKYLHVGMNFPDEMYKGEKLAVGVGDAAGKVSSNNYYYPDDFDEEHNYQLKLDIPEDTTGYESIKIIDRLNNQNYKGIKFKGAGDIKVINATDNIDITSDFDITMEADLMNFTIITKDGTDISQWEGKTLHIEIETDIDPATIQAEYIAGSNYLTIDNRVEFYLNSVYTSGSSVTSRYIIYELSGTVWEDDNKDRVIDAGENKVGNAPVTIQQRILVNGVYEWVDYKTTTSQTDGTYKLNLAQGSYRVKFGAHPTDATYEGFSTPPGGQKDISMYSNEVVDAGYVKLDPIQSFTKQVKDDTGAWVSNLDITDVSQILEYKIDVQMPSSTTGYSSIEIQDILPAGMELATGVVGNDVVIKYNGGDITNHGWGTLTSVGQVISYAINQSYVPNFSGALITMEVKVKLTTGIGYEPSYVNNANLIINGKPPVEPPTKPEVKVKSAISGFVWNDANGDGVKDATETYPASQSVTLWEDDGLGTYTQVATTTTDGTDGTYKFAIDGTTAGKNYKVKFLATVGSDCVTVKANDNHANVDGHTDAIVVDLGANQSKNANAGYVTPDTPNPSPTPDPGSSPTPDPGSSPTPDPKPEQIFKKMPLNERVMPGQNVKFVISGFGNDNDAAMQNYVMTDILPKGLQFVSFELPAFTKGAGLTYDVAYLTNQNDSYTYLHKNVDAGKKFVVNAPTNLAEGEYITRISIMLKSAPVGFGMGDKIYVTCKVEEDLETNYLVNNAMLYFNGESKKAQTRGIWIGSYAAPKTQDGKDMWGYAMLAIGAMGTVVAAVTLERRRRKQMH